LHITPCVGKEVCHRRNINALMMIDINPSYSWWIADPGAGLVRLGAALERNL
jgi:hypothetical protein